jgi:hypothetical protein
MKKGTRWCLVPECTTSATDYSLLLPELFPLRPQLCHTHLDLFRGYVLRQGPALLQEFLDGR